MADKFSAFVQWSDEDQCFIALAPEIEGLNAFGDTAAEALEQLEIAKGLLLDAWSEKGVPFPEPQKAVQHSGQMRLRLPRSLHASLSRAAELDGVSLNQYMVMLLSERNERRAWVRQPVAEATSSAETASNSTSSFDTFYGGITEPRLSSGASSKKLVQ